MRRQSVGECVGELLAGGARAVELARPGLFGVPLARRAVPASRVGAAGGRACSRRRGCRARSATRAARSRSRACAAARGRRARRCRGAAPAGARPSSHRCSCVTRYCVTHTNATETSMLRHGIDARVTCVTSPCVRLLVGVRLEELVHLGVVDARERARRQRREHVRVQPGARPRLARPALGERRRARGGSTTRRGRSTARAASSRARGTTSPARTARRRVIENSAGIRACRSASRTRRCPPGCRCTGSTRSCGWCASNARARAPAAADELALDRAGDVGRQRAARRSRSPSAARRRRRPAGSAASCRGGSVARLVNRSAAASCVTPNASRKSSMARSLLLLGLPAGTRRTASRGIRQRGREVVDLEPLPQELGVARRARRGRAAGAPSPAAPSSAGRGRRGSTPAAGRCGRSRGR